MASKAFSEVLAKEVGPLGIKVTIIEAVGRRRSPASVAHDKPTSPTPRLHIPQRQAAERS